jgi:PPM family protein phosphatase
MQIEVGQGTHTGLRRAHNEDTLYCDEAQRLWIVADGMGGLDSGEVASAMARDCVIREVGLGKPLTEAVEIAHREILSTIENSNDRNRRMGTTIVALLREPEMDRFEIAWVGDSRIYRFFQSTFEQISHDHSYVQELLDRELITRDEARRSPHRNLVTQALGAVAENELRVASRTGQLKPGMQILLCTDGLNGEVEDEDIADILDDEAHAQDAVDALIQAALNGGGNDNITVVLLRTAAAIA